MTADRKIETALLAAVGVMLVLLFHVLGNTVEAVHSRSVFVWMVARWHDKISFGADYSHGWLIPLVSIAVIWWRRRELADATRRLSPSALALIVGALVLHWVGAKMQQPRLSLVSLIGLLWSIPYLLYGRAFARYLLFPCAYLLFCIPWNFLDALTFPLRILAASLATGILNGLAFPAARSGSAILVGAGADGVWLDVADPCSGLRSLLAMMAVIAAYGYFVHRAPWRQWLLFLLAVPIVIAANVVRIATVAMVASVFGEDIAMRIYHDLSGYIVFAAAVLLALGVSRLIAGRRKPDAPDAPPAAPASRPACPQRGLRARWPYYALLFPMALTALALQYGVDVTLADEPGLRMTLPRVAGEWRGEPLLFCHAQTCAMSPRGLQAEPTDACPECGEPLHTMSRIEYELLPRDTEIAKGRYEHPDGRVMLVTIVLSGGERNSIHRPQRCLTGQGNEIVKSQTRSLPLENRKPVEAMFLDVIRRPLAGEAGSSANTVQHFSYAYWFVGKTRETPSHLARMFWLGWDRVVHNVAHRWAYITVMTGRRPDSSAHIDATRDFVSSFYPRIVIPADRPPGP